MKALQKYLAHNNPLPSEKVSKFEEGLCLPKIPERPPNSIPKSSMQSRKKVMLKKNFLSQTAQSPEQQQQQEHLYKEVKYMLSPKKMSSSTKRKQSKESVALPEIRKSDEKKNKSEMAKLAKGRSTSEGKMNLDRILNDPYLFMQDYFTDINTKLK